MFFFQQLFTHIIFPRNSKDINFESNSFEKPCFCTDFFTTENITIIKKYQTLRRGCMLYYKTFRWAKIFEEFLQKFDTNNERKTICPPLWMEFLFFLLHMLHLISIEREPLYAMPVVRYKNHCTGNSFLQVGKGRKGHFLKW